jgi:hypothetical protein
MEIPYPKETDMAEPMNQFNRKIIEEFHANGGKVGGRDASPVFTTPILPDLFRVRLPLRQEIPCGE